MKLNLVKSNQKEEIRTIECEWFTHCRDGAIVVHFKDKTQITIEPEEYDYYGTFDSDQ